MPRDGRETDRPLLGPGGLIPAVEAVSLKRQSGIAALRGGWLPRHTVALVVLTPVLFLAYRSALVTGATDLTWNLLLGAMAVVGSMIITTYLPLRGAQRAAGASCALMAGLLVPGATLMLNGATTPLSGLLALGVLGLGLWQRLSGTSTCG